jgi:hypothetical protein|tara:strand:- start:12 stop:206 length:195 start_codon:yes stop_codon:yes gene_type:complete
MTKASIVQRLLDQKHITAEEAVILLQNESSQIPMYTTNPYFTDPTWTGTPPSIYCETTTTENID